MKTSQSDSRPTNIAKPTSGAPAAPAGQAPGGPHSPLQTDSEQESTNCQSVPFDPKTLGATTARGVHWDEKTLRTIQRYLKAQVLPKLRAISKVYYSALPLESGTAYLVWQVDFPDPQKSDQQGETAFNTLIGEDGKPLTNSELIKLAQAKKLKKRGPYRKKSIEQYLEQRRIEKERLAIYFEVVKFWNKQPGLIPLKEGTKKYETSMRLLRLSQMGKLKFDFPEAKKRWVIKNSEWFKVISDLNTIATDPRYGKVANDWARRMSIESLLFGTYNNRNSTELRKRCPFVFMLETDVKDVFKRFIFDEDTHKKTFNKIKEYVSDLIYSDKIREDMDRLCKNARTFYRVNSYGISESDRNVDSILNLFFKYVFEEKGFSYEGLFWKKTWNNFFTFCLNIDFIYDAKNGELFEINGEEKYWFQLTEPQRRAIVKKKIPIIKSPIVSESISKESTLSPTEVLLKRKTFGRKK